MKRRAQYVAVAVLLGGAAAIPAVIGTRLWDTDLGWLGILLMGVMAVMASLAGVLFYMGVFGEMPGAHWRIWCPYCGKSFYESRLRDSKITPTLTCPYCLRTFRW